MKRKDYEKASRELQVVLCGLQEWGKHEGLRVVVLFEGRDAAGKGGVIKAIDRVPGGGAAGAVGSREVAALPAARDVPHLPAAGEVVIFDSELVQSGRGRNRDGCTKAQHRRCLVLFPSSNTSSSMTELTWPNSGWRSATSRSAGSRPGSTIRFASGN
jgi:polyphosphate kinase 2 (PPK2 family)